MHAVGYTQSLPISHPEALIDLEVENPVPRSQDLLVRVLAASVNPVDIKTRLSQPSTTGQPRILGWDACGEVIATGEAVSWCKPGDQIWYAGQIDRPGSNSEFQCVDERIVSLKPRGLDHIQSAALPLTSLTAWECLFDRLGYDATPSASNEATPLLLINGAGGLGSMVLQLCQLAGIPVIATAGRKESRDWCIGMGASEVLDHTALWQLEDGKFPRILCAHDTDNYFSEMARLVAPQGLLCAVASTKKPHDIQPLMAKSAGFVWELMFTRSLFQTSDMSKQGEILRRIAEHVDQGALKTTMNKVLYGMNAETFIAAHKSLENGNMIGKLVIGYENN